MVQSNVFSGKVSRVIRYDYLSGCVNSGLLVCLVRRGCWHPLFRSGAQDWELENFVDLFRLLQEGHPTSQEWDKWRWKRQRNGGFIVASFYHLMGEGDTNFPWKGIWVSRVPTKLQSKEASSVLESVEMSGQSEESLENCAIMSVLGHLA
ncbi:hypothetical protein Acr_23g0013630 [Actinidia rufa]|uniref:Uncharacterized protein n=1 Tax=Actinidia rufa TaxID=165716 RepID=A0A7J0GQF3_9ERIC|nr:hypothetical protein Acr_23g0013630 [Actinidia rufa]